MRCAAALPALALLAGVSAGAMLLPEPSWTVAALIVSWCAAFAALRLADRTVLVSCLVVGFAAVGALVSTDASRRAFNPPLRQLLESEGLLNESRQAGDVEPIVLEGALWQDAAPGAAGISLRMTVERVVLHGQSHAARGGVTLSVGGALASHRAPEWRSGRVIRLPALLRRPARYLNPGVADEERVLARRGTTLVGTVKSGALVQVVRRGSRRAELAALARNSARQALRRSVARWSDRSCAIVTAILIGDRAGLDVEVQRRLQEAGTFHVIAISGGNIAIFAALLLGLLTTFGLSGNKTLVIPISALAMYAYVVGGGASVMRATLMAVTYLAARIADHRSHPLNILAVAAGLIAIAAPLSILDAGFLLTFGATLGILVGARHVARLAGDRRWLRPPLALFGASVSAEIALFPVGAYVFSRVTFAGLILNFIAIPLMSVVQVAGMAALGLSALHTPSAAAAGYVAHLGAAGLVGSARLVDLAPWLSRRVPPPHIAAVFFYGASLTAWVGCRTLAASGRTPRRWMRGAARVAAVATVATGVVIFFAPPAPWAGTGGRLSVIFLDVGQADAALVRFPNGRSLLIDAGGQAGAGAFDVGSRVLAPALWSLGVRRLDYLALTHGDPDHIGGATASMRIFRPREVWEGVPVPPFEPLRRLREQAGTIGAGWRTLQAGDVLHSGGVELRVWHPPPPDWERQRVRNDDSLVIELRLGGVSFLMTGDIGAAVETALSGKLAPAGVRILKVPHHGSATSSSSEFLAAARPAVAVMSAGRGNRFGHPVPAVLRRYRAAGAAVFRTDEDGAVRICTDGRSVAVGTHTGRRLTLTTRP